MMLTGLRIIVTRKRWYSVVCLVKELLELVHVATMVVVLASSNRNIPDIRETRSNSPVKYDILAENRRLPNDTEHESAKKTVK